MYTLYPTATPPAGVISHENIVQRYFALIFKATLVELAALLRFEYSQLFNISQRTRTWQDKKETESCLCELFEPTELYLASAVLETRDCRE